ncbi:hypothetical protein QBC44DRAFT_364047 [Cladorrhinum sp. PSN332]|nr:hypothetical protein QBC44DRAFT_364047 [Cladorrhinum sp. PSN332]
MIFWKTFPTILLLLLASSPSDAADGPIRWADGPGGGPETLRKCARLSFGDNYAASAWTLQYVLGGCETIACICRPDLIPKAHSSIKKAVTHSLNCGPDSAADVDAALKVYNDYCASNGFAVPGWAYVPPAAATTFITQTTPTVAGPTGSADAGGDGGVGGVLPVPVPVGGSATTSPSGSGSSADGGDGPSNQNGSDANDKPKVPFRLPTWNIVLIVIGAIVFLATGGTCCCGLCCCC